MPQVANIPIVAAPPEEKLGPAMQALTVNQRRFVVAFLETGGSDQNRAAELAGYGGTPGARKVIACRMMQNPAIMAAIREQADVMLRGDAIMAAAVLRSIANDRAHKDRFKAAVELLNRSGLIVATQHNVNVQVDVRTDAEIMADIRRMVGSNPELRKIAAEVIDGDFEEVKPDDLSDIFE